MESYLMMLYVTLEQETSLKNFFTDQGWAFCKPDLSVTTDQLGPAKVTVPNLDRDSGSATSIAGKRKAQGVPKSAPKVKLIKVLTGTLSAESNSENVLNRNNENQEKDRNETTSQETEQLNIQAAVHYEEEEEDVGNSNVMIKVENINYNIEEVGEEYTGSAQNEDVGDEENEDTDTDDGMEDTYTEAEEKKVEAEFEWKPKTKVNKKVVEGEKIDGTKCIDTQEDVIEDLLTQSMHQNTYKCCICTKKIKIKYNMKRHLRSHLPDQINCIMCNRFFDTLEEKEEHMKTRHTCRHICETCGVSFKRKSDLNAHIVKHDSLDDEETSSAFFRCTYENCGKVFFRQGNFQYHLNKHSGEKPFQCIKCHKTFHSKYVKNDHEKMCLFNKQYTCDVCGNVFKQRSGLYNHKQAEHERSEKGYTCETCSVSFKFSSGLIRHKRDKHQCLDAYQQTETNEIANIVHSFQVPTKEYEFHSLKEVISQSSIINTESSIVNTQSSIFNNETGIAKPGSNIVYTQTGIVNTQSSNSAVFVVADMAAEQLETTTSMELEDTHVTGIADAAHAGIMTTMTDPMLEKNAEINIERVIVVHQMTAGLPEHLDEMNE